MTTPDTLASLIAKMPHTEKQVMVPTYIGSVANGEPIPLSMPQHDEFCVRCKLEAALDVLAEKLDEMADGTLTRIPDRLRACAAELRVRGVSEETVKTP